MDALIKIKNSSYDRYEELLLRRDGVRKEGYQLEIEYSRVFGELIIAVFQEQLKCVKRKKTIEFCQAAVNHGKNVDQKELQQFIEEATEKLRNNIEDMVKDYESSKAAAKITEADQIQIKKLYHKMVKLIHPDINPMVKDSEDLQDLWSRTIMAYNCNDLRMLQELDVLTAKAINSMNAGEQIEIDIPDIEDKISELEEEIRKLMDADPYQYKFLLADKEAVDEKKASLSQELKAYQEYGKQLDGILDGLLTGGVKITWLMN